MLYIGNVKLVVKKSFKTKKPRRHSGDNDSAGDVIVDETNPPAPNNNQNGTSSQSRGSFQQFVTPRGSQLNSRFSRPRAKSTGGKRRGSFRNQSEQNFMQMFQLQQQQMEKQQEKDAKMMEMIMKSQEFLMEQQRKQ